MSVGCAICVLITLLVYLQSAHSESIGPHRSGGEANSDSIPPDAPFARDSTLSPSVRAAIARSARRMDAYQEHLLSQMLIPGLFSADELPSSVEGAWHALTIVGSRVSLVPVQVRLRRAPNRRATGDPSIPGAWVETDIQDSILFIVRRGPWVRRAAVPTWFLGHARFSPGQRALLPAPFGKRWSIFASKEIRFPPSGTMGYEIHVRDRVTSRSQKLGGWQLGVSPDIQWIGDLDGDGRLDMFVFDDSDESGSVSWTLYLSSRTKGDSLFEMAAWFGTPGC